MEDRLVFLVGPPRSGTTLLARLLHANGGVFVPPEPHLAGPLAHLGLWAAVDRAPYDPRRSEDALRRFVGALPGGEADWYAAARAYMDALYGRMWERAPAGTRWLVDKTPANGLVLDFLRRVYPGARYLILTRHPAAIFASYARSFFDGDFEAAARHDPILARYLPPMGSFLRAFEGALHRLDYEGLVDDPASAMARVAAFLDLPFDEGSLIYGGREAPDLGDPIGVPTHDRPVGTSRDRWVADLLAEPARFEVVARQLALVSAADLETWGTPAASLWAPLAQADPAAWPRLRPRWTRWTLQRKLLALARKDIDRRPHGPVLRRLRFYADVLLRGQGSR